MLPNISGYLLPRVRAEAPTTIIITIATDKNLIYLWKEYFFIYTRLTADIPIVFDF
jgi:hypothetical protein